MDVTGRVDVAALQQMKRDGRKIVGVVVYDYQMAQIVDRAGVDLLSVGDSVGTTFWGQERDADLTLEQMRLACRAVRRGVSRALVSCDVPSGPTHQGPAAAVEAAKALAAEGADVVKLEATSLEVVRAVVDAGVPVWAQMGNSPDCVALARRLEEAGVAMLDFRHSGPVAGAAVTQAVSIPVLGGLGGGPWLDGRIRAIGNAVGYLARALDDEVERYANIAKVTFEGIQAYAADVRAARQVKGEPTP